MGSSFPEQGSNLHHLHWKLAVLTTGPPGKSPLLWFYIIRLSLKLWWWFVSRWRMYTIQHSELTEAPTVNVDCFPSSAPWHPLRPPWRQPHPSRNTLCRHSALEGALQSSGPAESQISSQPQAVVWIYEILFPAQALLQALSFKCNPIPSIENQQEGSFSNLRSSTWLLRLVLIPCFPIAASSCWTVVVEAALMRQRWALKTQLAKRVKVAKIRYLKKSFIFHFGLDRMYFDIPTLNTLLAFKHGWFYHFTF